MYIIMIAVHKDNKNNTVGFRVIDKDTNEIKDVPYKNVFELLNKGTINIDNLCIENNTLKGSNGSLDRYPVIVDKKLATKSIMVIIEELVDSKYNVCNYAGVRADVTEEIAIKYASTYGIANGKVVTDSETGNKHLSSINGSYEKSKGLIDKGYGESLKAKINIVGSKYILNDKYEVIGVEDKYKNTKELKIGKGVLSIGNRAFEYMKLLEKIELPNTIEKIGDSAFLRCERLTEINIPEGVSVIPNHCFAACTSLEKIIMPNSLTKIGSEAFKFCTNLKIIEVGQNNLDIDIGAVPSKTKVVRRGSDLGKVTITENVEENRFMAIADGINEDGKRFIRLINVKNPYKKYSDIETSKVSSSIRDGKIKVDNIEVVRTGLIRIGEKLPSVDYRGDLTTESKSTIINQVLDLGYLISNAKGNIYIQSNQSVIKKIKEGSTILTNGVIAQADNKQYIMPVGKQFVIIDVPRKQVGVTNDAFNIKIKTNDSTNLTADSGVSVSVEINENNVFECMTQEQIKALKEYYVTYTVNLYASMAKSIRLELSPGKASKLSVLRGENEWEFAGVWDAGFTGASHCALGHALRYEYYAIPSTDDIKHKNRKERMELITNSETKIIFGETCASDFFHISKEDMDKLKLTRKTMSDEIALMSDIISNNKQKEYIKKTSLLNSIIEKMDEIDFKHNVRNGTTVKKSFGDFIGGTIIDFRNAGLPFPKSLVIQCTKHLRERVVDTELSYQAFYITAFPEYLNEIKLIYSLGKNSFYLGAMLYLSFVADVQLEGDYAYNPLISAKDNNRRDIGSYNKETRVERSSLISLIKRNCMLGENDYNFNSMLSLFEYIKELNKLVTKLKIELPVWGNELAIIVSEIFKSTKSRIINEKDPKVTEELKNKLETLIPVINAIIIDNSITNNDYSFIGAFNRLNYDYPTIRIIRPYIKDIKTASRSCYRGTQFRFYGYNNDVTEQKFLLTAYKDLKKHSIDDNFSTIITTIKNDVLKYSNESKLKKERDEFDRKEREKRENEIREERIRLENERNKAEKEKELAEKEKELAEKNTDSNDKDKLLLLRKILDDDNKKYNKKESYENIPVMHIAVNIAENGKYDDYNSLSYKQKKIIDNVINALTEKCDTSENKDNENKTYLIKDDKVLSDKVESILKVEIDSELYKRILSLSDKVFKICKTVEKTGRVSDKQLKHIDLAYREIK